MKKIAFFDTKAYDKYWFDKINAGRYDIHYFENKLTADTASLAKGCDGVCAFVNDTIDRQAVETLVSEGVKVLAMRCAGYSNVDFKAAYGKLHVVRVPAYSPYAVAEHAFGLLLTVNRKLHRAYNRTRDFNFSIVGLTGIDLRGKTIGIIGTGKIGEAMIDIAKGFGMRVVAYDLYPKKDADFEYLPLDELLKQSDVISLHCPLSDSTYHILDRAAFQKMKDGVFIINTSRGALVETEALLEALNAKKVRGAGLDVYEEEGDLFFEDYSGEIIQDDLLALLVSRPNVVLTAHQAFLTEEALSNIAETTLGNLDDFFAGKPLKNEVCYYCHGPKKEGCKRGDQARCF